jgi:hypothetical protein
MKKPERLGDAPVQPEYVERMNALAHALDTVFNGELKGEDRPTGFVLLVFPFGDCGRCNFISNGAGRKDIVALMREMIQKFEGQPETGGHA